MTLFFFIKTSIKFRNSNITVICNMLILSLPLKLRWIIPFLFLTSKLEKTANSLPQFVASLHSVPNSYKYALIFILLRKVFTLCFNIKLFHQHLKRNGYPVNISDICIKKNLDKLYVKKVVHLRAPKKQLTCVLPILGKK